MAEVTDGSSGERLQPGACRPQSQGLPELMPQAWVCLKMGWALEMLPQKKSLNEALAQVHEAQRDTFIVLICILSNPYELHNANFKKNH